MRGLSAVPQHILARLAQPLGVPARLLHINGEPHRVYDQRDVKAALARYRPTSEYERSRLEALCERLWLSGADENGAGEL